MTGSELCNTTNRTTEGLSWKLDQLRVIATVDLHSMTAGIAM